MNSISAERGRKADKRILIVDDHPLLRRGLAALIHSQPELTVCAEADTFRDALEAIDASHPDLVILDLELGDVSGLDLLKDMKVRHPGIPALVLSMHEESVYAERCLRAGARGYVSKQQIDTTLLVAIRDVLGGELFMSRELEKRLAVRSILRTTPSSGSRVERLSDRELQVFRLIGQGRGTRWIAEAIGLSIKTIESHRENIKNKLDIDSAPELARRATRWVEGRDAG